VILDLLGAEMGDFGSELGREEGVVYDEVWR